MSNGNPEKSSPREKKSLKLNGKTIYRGLAQEMPIVFILPVPGMCYLQWSLPRLLTPFLLPRFMPDGKKDEKDNEGEEIEKLHDEKDTI